MVDFCLTVKNLGYDAYILPLFAHHRSHGDSISEKYFETQDKLLNKRRSKSDSYHFG